MAIEIEHAVTDRGPRGSKSVRLVFLAIARAADEYGFAKEYVGEAYLGRQALCDVRTVRRAIEQLEREGWLAVRRKSVAGRASVYFVNLAKLAIGTHPGGSCRPTGKQRPKNQAHLNLEGSGTVRFASGAKPPTGERNGKRARSASGGESPTGRQACGNPAAEEIPPDILNNSHRTFSTAPPDILCSPFNVLSILSKNVSTPIPLPLSLAVENEQKPEQPQKQVQVLPDEGKDERREQATASATAKAGRGSVLRMGLESRTQQREQRRDRREAGRWNAIAHEGTETGVAAAAGRVIRACGFTDPRLTRIIVIAIEAHLAANRTSEVPQIEAGMVKAWRKVCENSEYMRHAVSPKFFFSDGRWADRGMWPYDEDALRRLRRSGVGTR